jgi:hypothetical protein
MPDLNDFSEEQRLVLVAQIQDWQVSLLWVSSLIPRVSTRAPPDMWNLPTKRLQQSQ